MSASSVNPLVRLRDAVWRPTPVSLRRLALLGVITNSAIIVSGGVVRVTASGLGCPTWPKCTGDSLVPTSAADHPALNMAIEFSNRLLTYVLLAAGVAVYIAARRLRPRRPGLVGLALLQPLGVVAQAVWGGVTVLVNLHPAAVAVHYLLSIAIIAAAVALYVRTGEGDEPARILVAPRVRTLAFVLTAVSVAVLSAGTVVTGTGPHAGDGEARRFAFEIEQVTKVHSLLAWTTVALTAALLLLLHRERPTAKIRRRSVLLLGALLAQGALGYVQYFTGVPALLVILHMLGSALLWLAVLGVVFSLRDRGPLAAPADRATAAQAAPAPAAGASSAAAVPAPATGVNPQAAGAS